MKSELRQSKIEEHLQKVELASLDEIANQVDASVSTVRRDLIALEASGILKRTYGGARVLNPRTDEFIFSKRDTRQLEEKKAIGQACAQLIQSDQSVIVDAGSTPYHVACFLEDKAPQIITNSLPVANQFASAHQVEVIVSGGVIYPRLGVLVGSLAVETFQQMHVDVAIMGAGGITPEGVTNSHVLLIEIQKAMIAAAQKVIFCLDHTKLGRKSVAFLCPLEEVDVIVTDSLTPAPIIDQIRAASVEVIVAETAV